MRRHKWFQGEYFFVFKVSNITEHLNAKENHLAKCQINDAELRGKCDWGIGLGKWRTGIRAPNGLSKGHLTGGRAEPGADLVDARFRPEGPRLHHRQSHWRDSARAQLSGHVGKETGPEAPSL